MDDKITDWDVQKYGRIYHKETITVSNRKIELIVYIYKDRFFQELWNDNYRIHYSEVIN